MDGVKAGEKIRKGSAECMEPSASAEATARHVRLCQGFGGTWGHVGAVHSENTKRTQILENGIVLGYDWS